MNSNAPRLDCPDGHGNVAMPGEENHWDMHIRPGKLALQLKSAYPWQIHIEDKAAGWLPECPPQEFFCRAVTLHPNSFRPQQTFYGVAGESIAVDYANRSIDRLHSIFMDVAIIS
jgi:hypothetical protein